MEEIALTPRPVEYNGRVYTFTGKLRPFQVEAVKYARYAKRTFITHEMGLGKSVCALTTFFCERAWPFVIFTPNKNKIQWVYEIKKWVPGWTIGWIGEVPKNLKNIVVANGYDCDVIIVNDELLSRRQYLHHLTPSGKRVFGNQYIDEFNKHSYKGCIVDESHRYANHKSARSNAAKLFLKQFPFRLFLTGTPINGMAKKYINQLQLLGRLNDLGGWPFFVRRYCGGDIGPTGYFSLDGNSNLEELVARMSRICYVRKTKKEVYPELPAVQRTTIYIIASNKSAYEIANKNFNQWLQLHREVSVNEAENQVEVLRQLAGLGKIDSVKEWVDNFMEETEVENSKLIVFSYHRNLQWRLIQLYPEAARIWADDNMQIRQDNIDRFQTDPKSRLLLASLMAGGESLNLTSATHILFTELPWTPDIIDQAEARSYGRLDYLHGLNSYFMLAEDTVDIDLADLLDQRRIAMEKGTDGMNVDQKGMVNRLINKLREKEKVYV